MMVRNSLSMIITKAAVRLRSWTTTMLDEAAGPAVALQATAAWFKDAAIGYSTPNGSYALLYTLAADIIWREQPSDDRTTATFVLDSIPLPGSEAINDLSRLYSLIYMWSLWGHWTRGEIELISSHISNLSWNQLTVVQDLYSQLMNSPAGSVLRRALDATEGHECHGDEKCARASVLWEDEDQKGANWRDYRIDNGK